MRFALLVAFAGAAACRPATPPDDSRSPLPRDTVTERDSTIVFFDGTVRHSELEGGFYAIRGDDSVTYDPTNLPERYRRDGLRVGVRARVRSDMAGIHMVGPIIEIIEITER